MFIARTDGDFTCVFPHSCTVIDYIIMSEELVDLYNLNLIAENCIDS